MRISKMQIGKNSKYYITIGMVLIIFIAIVLLNKIPILTYNAEIKKIDKVQGEKLVINEASFEDVAENSLLSTGLEIIGLAIAVWTGLNIVNLVTRKEVEEVEERMKTIIDEVQKKNDELNTIYNNVENISKNEFLKELLKTDSDLITKYFYDKFLHIKCFPDVIYQLLSIEQIFSQIYYMHTSANANAKNVRNETEELDKQIDKTLIYIKQYKEILDLKDIENYLKFRKAEGLFYRGYVLDSEREIYKAYMSAIKIYIEISEYFIKDFKEMTENKNETIFPEEYEIFSYYSNTLGEAYSKILQKCPKYAQIDIIGEKAKFYCELAIKYAKENDREVYYRNLGCVYERLEKVKGKTLYSKIILDNYEKAFQLTINKPQMSRKQMGNVYHTYLSYLNNYIKNNLKLPENAVVQDIINNFDNNWKYEIHPVNVMYQVASIAIVDDIRKSLNIVMYGFVNGYIVLLKQIKNAKCIEEIFEDDVKSYLEKMKWAVETLQLMGVNDNYTKELKSFYEAL